MPLLDRTHLLRFHMLLAAFVFPVAVMFLITGSFYTWGIKGSYNSEELMITLSQPLAADAEAIEELVRAELGQRSIAVPSGHGKIKKGGTSYLFEWTGADRDVILQPTTNDAEAKLTIKDTSWYRRFVQLHKAKGGKTFKIYAAFFAGSLFLILASGFLMALQIPKYRGQALISATLGLVIFLLALNFS